MVQELNALGFRHDPAQVAARRAQGRPLQGLRGICLPSTLSSQVLYQIGNAPVREYPYPAHLRARHLPRRLLRRDACATCRRRRPEEPRRARPRQGGDGYPARGVLPLTQKHLGALDRSAARLLGARAAVAARPALRRHHDRQVRALPRSTVSATCAARVQPRGADRAATAPPTRSARTPTRRARCCRSCSTCRPTPRCRTSAPRSTCRATRHFVWRAGRTTATSKFQRMLTMPYVPNALFAFMKTPNSFHGVEPIDGARGAPRPAALRSRDAPPGQKPPAGQRKFTS